MDSRKNIPASPEKSRSELASMVHGTEPKTHNGSSYQQLTRAVPLALNQKYVCCGARRESILLDMTAAKLQNFYEIFLKQFQDEEAATPRLDENEEKSLSASSAMIKSIDYKAITLQHIVNYVSDIFKNNTISTAEKENQLAILAGKEKLLTLEDVVEKKIGLCRHAALLTGYLLVNLIQHTDAEGQVFRFRTNLKVVNPSSSLHAPQTFPHAVIIYISGNKNCYLLDSTRRFIDSKGLVVKLTKLDAKRRNILKRNYEKFDVASFVEDIFLNYQAAMTSAQFRVKNGVC